MILWLELCKNEHSTLLHIQRHALKLHKHGIKLKCTLGRHSSWQMYYEESPPNLIREFKWEMETNVIYLGKAPHSCPEETINAHMYPRIYVQNTEKNHHKVGTHFLKQESLSFNLWCGEKSISRKWVWLDMTSYCRKDASSHEHHKILFQIKTYLFKWHFYIRRCSDLLQK